MSFWNWSYKSTSDDENISSIYCKILESYPPQPVWLIYMKPDNEYHYLLYPNYYEMDLNLFTKKDVETLKKACFYAVKLEEECKKLYFPIKRKVHCCKIL
jgi:hypothetical protein